ncbi:tRNA (guanosine(46)-N7)-methyltransferase TrmB [Pontivivens insulae]|nr:tRNA (guanosine(46)-N7)-methyltransferase TrmB [Pontivivens insulae]
MVRMEKHRTALRPDGTPWRNFYGRRHGKKLRPAQQRDMDGALVEIQPKGITRADNPTRTPLDLHELFGREAPTWLEIGFGAGEHMFHQAGLNPDVGIIGCEPYINGVAQFMSKMRDAGLSNVRVHPGDARDLLEVLPEASLDKVFLLYPDPWPKTRHHRRRFVVPENLVAVARALTPGGIFRVATDIPDYVRQTLEVTQPMPEFEWHAEAPADWRDPWSDWTRTRYEAKAIREDRTPHYLTFRRV